MGQGQSPTSEELGFIYGLLCDGWSDADVIRHYEELRRKGQLGSLPFRSDVRFIRQRRKEYEASRAVLETTLKREADPSLAKAREEHLAEVRGLIEEWREKLNLAPTVEEVMYCAAEERYRWIELYMAEGAISGPLPQCLREHLPFPTLWQSLSELVDDKFPEYVKACHSLARETTEQRQTLGQLQTLVYFERPFLELVSKKQLGETDPEYLAIKWEEHGDLLCIKAHDNGIERWIVLEAQNPLDYVQPYEAMCARLQDSQLYANVLSLSKEIDSLVGHMMESLNEIVIRRDYVIHTCRLCPGQPSVSP
jgi:hypothetical protein